jgi:hypothetical protein
MKVSSQLLQLFFENTNLQRYRMVATALAGMDPTSRSQPAQPLISANRNTDAKSCMKTVPVMSNRATLYSIALALTYSVGIRDEKYFYVGVTAVMQCGGQLSPAPWAPAIRDKINT